MAGAEKINLVHIEGVRGHIWPCDESKDGQQNRKASDNKEGDKRLPDSD